MPAKNVMPKFRRGELHSGSKHGPKVKSAKQAKAIEISEAREEGANIPKKRGTAARNARVAKEKL